MIAIFPSEGWIEVGQNVKSGDRDRKHNAARGSSSPQDPHSDTMPKIAMSLARLAPEVSNIP